MQIHGYPYDATGSTFIVEMHDQVWRDAGFAALAPQVLPPGTSDEASIEKIRELFAGVLGGHAVHANNSKWISFGTLRCASWRHGNVILLGDAAHTAHFSIGSGTKLAMEDALALAACLGRVGRGNGQPGLHEALAAFGPKGMEHYYGKEPSARWRAWYDLTYGRLLAMCVRANEYNWACAVMKGKGADFV